MPRNTRLKAFTRPARSHIAAASLSIALFAVVGAYILQHSFAFSSNPVGAADYCLLANGVTVIRGWAHDPEAPAGSLPNVRINVTGQAAKTVPTSISGYRDVAINNYLKGQGTPTSSTYGWSASYTGLYKGGSYIVSGTNLNVGAGANTALIINANHHVDGDSTKPYFANQKIPDACMPSKPVPPPAPSPTPVPLPHPPAPSPTPPHKTPGPAPITTNKVTTSNTVSSAADATIVSGTRGAAFTIPAGGGSKIQIAYGTDAANLDLLSNSATAANDKGSLTITGLTPLTTYWYQIIRANNDGSQSGVSPVASFDTKGYTVILKMSDGSTTPLKDTEVTLAELKTKSSSDNTGTIRFDDVAEGQYTLLFAYNKHNYKLPFVVADNVSGNSGNQANTFLVTVPVDVSKIEADQPQASPKQPAKRNTGVWLIILIGTALLVAGLIIFLKRRRQPQKPKVTFDFEGSSPKKTRGSQAEQVAEHTGISLKDMVLKSMAEEAERRRRQK